MTDVSPTSNEAPTPVAPAAEPTPVTAPEESATPAPATALTAASSSQPVGSVAAWLSAQATRWAVPAIVAVLVSWAAKSPLHLTYAWQGVVTVAVGGAVSATFKFLEAKFSWARRILLATKPAAL